MKTSIVFEKEKMSERQVRDSIERAASHAQRIAEQKGEGVKSTEQFRRDMEKCAEMDKQKGKI